MTDTESKKVELKPCPKVMPLRFAMKVDFVGDCWIWKGAKQSSGYGHLLIDGKDVLAHRFSYPFQYGGIPSGMTLDHICRNRLCVNPYHLRPMTQKENNACGNSLPAINKRKTHCDHGHEFNEKNTRFKSRKDGVRRECKKCHSIRNMKYEKEKKNGK